MDEFTQEQLQQFMAVPFIHHYFYRNSDHLGSANWITDQDGHAVQYLHYLPYGQMLLNQQAAGYDEQYKFTGKERDAESGYDYFGARYYAPPLFHWTTVDPLVDNYLHITPYAYCGWNPIKFVDPDGRKIVVGTWYGRALAKLGVNNFEANTLNRLQYLKTVSPELNKAITTMESKKNVTVRIYPTSQYPKDFPKEVTKSNSWEVGVAVRDGTNTSIYYQDGVGLFEIDGYYDSSDGVLAHELGHAEDNMNGTYIVYNHAEAKKPNGNKIEKINGNKNERTPIFYENQVRQKEGEPARSYDYYKINNDSNQ